MVIHLSAKWGKLAGILAFEGGHVIENDIEKLKAHYAKGARYLTITWNNSTGWATSAQDAQSATKGLSEFGKQVIRTLDPLGIIIDVAHTGIKMIQDILAITKSPIIDSHAGVYALRNHYRNLDDDHIKTPRPHAGAIEAQLLPCRRQKDPGRKPPPGFQTDLPLAVARSGRDDISRLASSLPLRLGVFAVRSPLPTLRPLRSLRLCLPFLPFSPLPLLHFVDKPFPFWYIFLN